MMVYHDQVNVEALDLLYSIRTGTYTRWPQNKMTITTE